RRWLKAVGLRGLAGFAFVWVGAVAFYLLDEPGSLYVIFVGGCALGLTLFLPLTFLLVLHLSTSWAAHLRDRTVRHRFYDAGFSVTSEFGESRYGWEMLRRVEPGEEWWTAWLADGRAMLLSAEQLKPELCQALLDKAQEQIGKTPYRQGLGRS